MAFTVKDYPYFIFESYKEYQEYKKLREKIKERIKRRKIVEKTIKVIGVVKKDDINVK